MISNLHGEFPKIVGKPHKMGLGIKTEVCVGFYGSINPIKSALGIFVSVQIMARPSCEPIMLNPDLSPKFNVFWGKHGVNFEISIFDPQKALPYLRPHLLVCSVKKSDHRCRLHPRWRTPKKNKKKTFWLYMLGIHRSQTAFAKNPPTGVGVRLGDVITYVEFEWHRFTGLGFACPKSWESPIQ